MEKQKFYWDNKNDVFYLVNFIEETYFKIDKDSPFYKLCRHLYCGSWSGIIKKDITTNYKKCKRIEQIDGTEDL
ncbi:hypothetical protein PQE70_gp053 [Bacillus phage vB_BanS_Nate]|uniref:Uncharacterized protein n=1 Tax=Bacillus phage vB_BanS_Nate TaxID=2894788 RepID=A0AAE8YVQ7_9CAUD|nr:hypothetical protein PQE70_gp053 [Bacillus phage vB_BanS_Nate]UGO50906.1 hypothetical protein NATE_53 [Bacillus phage vB_BanS_Nate]